MQTSDATIGDVYDAVDKDSKPSYKLTKSWNGTAQKVVKTFERLVIVKELLYRKIKTKGLAVYQL